MNESPPLTVCLCVRSRQAADLDTLEPLLEELAIPVSLLRCLGVFVVAGVVGVFLPQHDLLDVVLKKHENKHRLRALTRCRSHSLKVGHGSNGSRGATKKRDWKGNSCWGNR